MADELPNEAPLPLFRAGERLMHAREEAGLSRAEITARTRIPERHLEAIERGDFAALPARAYAVGFSRTYAREVGLDEAEIVREVRSELGMAPPEADRRPAQAFEPGDPARVPSARLSWVSALVALAVVLVGAVLWRSYYAPAVVLPSLVPDEPPAPATQPAPAMPAPVQQAVGGDVIFTALENGVWVRFTDATGRQLMQKEMARGESWRLPSDASGPLVSTARPDALAITVGGRTVPPLAAGAGTVRDMPVSAEALLARPPVAAETRTAVQVQAAQPQAPRRAASRPAADQRADTVPAPVSPAGDAAPAEASAGSPPSTDLR